MRSIFIENKAIHAISKLISVCGKTLSSDFGRPIFRKKRPSGGRGCRGCWSGSAPGCSSVPGLSSCWHGQLGSDNPWIRLTSRGRAATGSQGSRAHKRSHWRLAEGARQSIRAECSQMQTPQSQNINILLAIYSASLSLIPRRQVASKCVSFGIKVITSD